jgi:hypothetical protein
MRVRRKEIAILYEDPLLLRQHPAPPGETGCSGDRFAFSLIASPQDRLASGRVVRAGGTETSAGPRMRSLST